MRVLLDTCVLSELYKPAPLPAVSQAIATLSDESLYLSVITVGELSMGIALLPEGRKKQDLWDWARRIETAYATRVLTIDPETAAIWGELTARAQQSGVALAAADGLIAATALRHGLHLMTRNVRDFQVTGVLLINPWAAV